MVISLALTVPAAVIMVGDSVATVLPGAVPSGRRAVMIMIEQAAQAYRRLSGLRGRAAGVPEMVRWPAGWLGTYPGRSGNADCTMSRRDGGPEVMDLSECTVDPDTPRRPVPHSAEHPVSLWWTGSSRGAFHSWMVP